MVYISQILTIVGILLETIAIFWASRTIFYSWKKWYYDNADKSGQFLKQRREAMRKEQGILLVLITVGAILQITGLLV